MARKSGSSVVPISQGRPVKRPGALPLFHAFEIDGENVLVSVDQTKVYIESKSNPGTWHRVTPIECMNCEGWKFRQQCRHYDLAVKYRRKWPIPKDSKPFQIVVIRGATMDDEADWSDGSWVSVANVMLTQSIPAESAIVMLQAMKRAVDTGRVSPDAPWMLFEFLAADFLGGS